MIAIYRKYRPSTFEHLIAQKLIAKILKNAAIENKLSHTYLFTGPRGVGKTTTARLIAKIANCEKREKDKTFSTKGEPCNSCTHCIEIDENRSLDVVEIDAASNRGIDEIRDLKESVRLAPATSRYKIFIIDEAHMLTKEAWNALLKTLEEPPAYTIFILATTENEKIPATISSRTQQFHFKRIPREEIIKKLKTITKEENIKIDVEALDLIAASAEGSFRDAESLLGHFIAYEDKNITLEEVENTIGKVGFHTISKLCESLLDKNLKNALEFINEVNEGGHNLSLFTKDIVQYLRRVAVLAYNPDMKKLFLTELMEEHVNTLESHSKKWNENHLKLLKNLIEAYSQMRYSQFPIIPLEIEIIESLK